MNDAGMEARRRNKGARARGLGLDASAREAVGEWSHDDDQRCSGETLSENASVACVEHGGSRVQRGHQRSSTGSDYTVNDDGLGTESTGSSLEGLRRVQSDRVEKRLWKDPMPSLYVYVPVLHI